MDRTREKRCPFCRQTIRANAVFCRHCNTDLDDEEFLIARRGARRKAIGLVLLFGASIFLILVGTLVLR